MGVPFGGFSGFMFSIGPAFIVICFVLVVGVIILAVIKGVSQWGKNNASPVLTVEAKIAAKRESVSSNTTYTDSTMTMRNTTYSTTYYATFEVESGDRMEFTVSGKEYGLLAEGDFGRLTFQGTRYKGFERKNDTNLSS